MNGGVVFLIVLVFLVLGGYGGWVIWSRMQASKNGLPPPSLNPFARSSGGSIAASNYPGPAPTGIKGWFDTQLRKFKNRNNRYASGAYEESGYNSASGGRGAGHRLDPDEAWDARVGNEAYYEEQELGLHEPAARGAQAPANPFENSAYESDRGRSRTRGYDENSLGAAGMNNPFGDEQASSLRGVSPRPLDHGVDTSYGGASAQKPKKDGSPNSSRRSAFHEEM